MLKQKLLIFLFIVFGFSHILSAQKEQQTTRILFIFDASQSMFGYFSSEPKITVAQKLFSEALDSLKKVEHLELALRVYGNRSNINNTAQDCEDTHLEVPFGIDNIDEIKRVIKTVSPKGTTPIARSLELSETDFPPCANCRNVIVLITDGIEACGGDPCAIARSLRTNNIHLKPFVIGMGLLEDYKKSFYCIGNYYDAKDKEQFKSVLGLVLAEALNNTTCQVNLLDVKGNPTETNVNMSFYVQKTGELKYNYVHTMNHKGLPDTLGIDPTVTYKIVVHSIPAVVKENVVLKAAQHNTIPIETPQGALAFKVKNGNQELRNIQATIKEINGNSTLQHQSIMATERYLVGTYEVELLTLPRLKQKIEIAQSKTTEFLIPEPGAASINILSAGYGSLYVKEGEQLELIYNLNVEKPSEILNLLPGEYTIVFRTKNSNRAFQTVEKTFTISSGKSVRISL